MQVIRLLVFLLLLSCQTPFSTRKKVPFQMTCEAVSRWSKKLDDYPYKISGRTLRFKMKGFIYGRSNEEIEDWRGNRIRGRITYLKSDFMRLPYKGVSGVINYQDGHAYYDILLYGKRHKIEMFIPPKRQYGYYNWGESQYALMCDHDKETFEMKEKI